ncbi:RNA polymerase sigma factor [Rufibacter sp. LB8]|uniref:RNA polymerase sigma factor n=1 Tax=Rufibacter sp. LB8 TaxID=2777781 RepID=UPI00178C6D9D|nr:sigma-70 family RNA polymerase sigma factor [Rufibacter sp. LB8]
MPTIDKTDRFLAVLQDNKGIIYKVTNAYCPNPEDRPDLAQEILVQLWQAFDGYDRRFQYSTWVYRIALNVAISFYRKESSRKKMTHPLPAGIFDFSDHSSAEDTETDLGLLQQAISQLKELDKALILLYLEEKPYREIAHIMGISESNVATKIARIKNLLKQKFSQLQYN